MPLPPISRRQFIGNAAAAAVGSLALPGFRTARAASAADTVSFFLIGDTHYMCTEKAPEVIEEVSQETTSRFLTMINQLPGTAIPPEARGGIVSAPRGVIHVGDLIHNGDKNGGKSAQMQETEWKAWQSAYGLDGKDGLLKWPVYEMSGNHDAPQGKGLIIDKIIERNPKRPGVTNVSSNGVHYSWDWGRVHFVNLGLIVGTTPETTRKRRYAALDSLEFLKADLAKNVGDSGRPVVLSHHVDIARYTKPCDPAAPFENKEWDACDVHAFYETIRSYQIAAIFYGHTHKRDVFRWDGANPKAAAGLPVFNVGSASHFNMETHALFHVEMSEKELLVREYASKDHWETAAWTPQSWSVALR